jgi:hypothetical protein
MSYSANKQITTGRLLLALFVGKNRVISPTSMEQPLNIRPFTLAVSAVIILCIPGAYMAALVGASTGTIESCRTLQPQNLTLLCHLTSGACRCAAASLGTFAVIVGFGGTFLFILWAGWGRVLLLGKPPLWMAQSDDD